MLSQGAKKRWQDLEERQRQSERQKNLWSDLERQRQSERQKNLWQDPEHHRKMSESQRGRIFSNEHRANLSKSQTGWRNAHWQGGTSFEPYCSKFNFKLKEQVREQYGRVCFICGKPESLNGQRLSVHHVDADKMQGCNGKKWSLVPLCKSCHGSRNLHHLFFYAMNLFPTSAIAIIASVPTIKPKISPFSNISG